MDPNAITPSSPALTTMVTWQLFLGTAGVLALLGLLIRLLNARAFFEIFLGAALFLGTWSLAWFLIPWDVALLVASALTIAQARIRRVIMHDLFVVMGCAGIAIHLAFLFPLKALGGILAAFLIYDLAQGRLAGIAMKVARATIRRGVIPGLIIPANRVEAIGPIRTAVDHPTAVFVGAGDAILPATIVARAAFSGSLQALVVSGGILIAVLLLGSRASLKPAPALAWLLPGAVVPFLILMIFKLV